MKLSLDRKGVSEVVADHIKKRIHEAKYKVGEKIPGEREMATALKVSRNTVREAYKILEAYGYITAKHGTGVFIATPEFQIRKMTDAFFVTTDHIKEFFAIRKILEVSTVQWAIERFSEEHVIEFDELIKESKEITSGAINYDKLSKLDQYFHLSLVSHTQNSVLIRIMHNLIDLLCETRMKSIQIPGRAIKSVEEHIKIIDAIKAKDILLAQKYMTEHLESVEQSITNSIDHTLNK